MLLRNILGVSFLSHGADDCDILLHITATLFYNIFSHEVGDHFCFLCDQNIIMSVYCVNSRIVAE
jgi:uncharacterized membrane protein YobD (UPF0266 family)